MLQYKLDTNSLHLKNW